MPHPPGLVQNQVVGREHQLSHVERRVETRSRSRSWREKTTIGPVSDSMYDYVTRSKLDSCGRSTPEYDVGPQPNRAAIDYLWKSYSIRSLV